MTNKYNPIVNLGAGRNSDDFPTISREHVKIAGATVQDMSQRYDVKVARDGFIFIYWKARAIGHNLFDVSECVVTWEKAK